MDELDLFNYIKGEDEHIDLTKVRTSLVALFDGILQSGEITDEEQLGKIARLRSKLEIELNNL